MKQKAVLLFSGGETSAYLTYRMKRDYSHLYDFIVLFTNTSKEREETLEFVRLCDECLGFGTVWVEGVTNPQKGKGVTPRVVTFDTALRDGELYEAMIAKHGIPNVNAPMCTRELKTYTANAYLRTLGKEWQKATRFAGIRADEMDRAYTKKGELKKGYIFPLFMRGWFGPITKRDVRDFWTDADFTGIPALNAERTLFFFRLRLLEHEGNCDACFKKSLEKLIRLAREMPSIFEWWAHMEDKYKDYIPESRKEKQKPGPVFFFRQNLSARDILRLSKMTDDEIKKILKIEDLRTAFNGCAESCEPM